jgi:ATP-dependent Clp protease adapter protein ClpS
MIAQELEKTLHHAFVDAREKRHQFIGVEHLLLALLANQSAAQVLRRLNVQFEALRTDLQAFIVHQTPVLAADRESDTQPTLGFQRVIQRAILHQQSCGATEVTGADVLVSIFAEENSRAAEVMKRHGVTRLDIVSAVSGAADEKAPDAAELQVVLYNDDYTPMQFVLEVLQQFFSMSEADAKETMLEVHRQGAAVCGLYERDAALDLVNNLRAYVRERGHPLKCGLVAPK